MNPLFIGLIGQLAQSGIAAYQQLRGATEAPNPNITKIAALIPIVVGINTALHQAGGVLQKAQAEHWAEDDPRWKPEFDAADAALSTAMARLT